MPDGSELAVDAAIEACVAEWRGGGLARTAAALGLGIDAATAGQLVRALARANKKRTLYTLTLADVVRVLVEARDAEIAVRHAGRGDPFTRTPSTIALAVRNGDVVHVALGISEARDPSPRTAWQLLAVWDADLVRNLAKARAWITHEPTHLSIPIVPRPDLEPDAEIELRRVLRTEILARPRDDEPRLVYADALIARGDPLGELIVAQCAIAAGNTDPKLAKRERELRRKHGATWLRGARQRARHAELRRGFVGSVTMTARQFAEAGKLFETEPIEELVFVQARSNDLDVLVAAPHLDLLDTISFAGSFSIFDNETLESAHHFLRRLSHVRVLEFRARFGAYANAMIGSIFEGIVWPRIERLRLALVGAGREARAEWRPENVWGSLCGAQIPKLKELAIAPFGHDRELAAAFPAATIRPL